MPTSTYRGRIAPTPTGYLHLGHGSNVLDRRGTCRRAGGTLVYRNEDLDASRCGPEFAAAAIEDLQWLGIRWQEGPDVGGPFVALRSESASRHLLASLETACQRRRDISQCAFEDRMWPSAAGAA